MSVLLFFIVSYILLSISLYLLFPKAGVPAIKGLIPGVNFMEWCTLIGRPKWYALLLLIPLVGFFIFAEMASRMVRSFGQYKLKSSAGAVVYAPASFTALAFNKDASYLGPALKMEEDYNNRINEAREKKKTREYEKLVKNNPFRKSAFREWIESISFAVFAAAFIRMFLIEAYVIPTPSMEGSLLVGDFLFVSKAHYGIRPPMTVAMIPLLHNRIPFINKESYLEKPSLEYTRLKPLESIDRNDPIVFNWPVGDSIYLTANRSYTVNQVHRDLRGYLGSDPALNKLVKNKEIITRPLDKKDHYIKRCLAVAGDSLQIINKQVYINGKAVENPSGMQFAYQIKLSRNATIRRSNKAQKFTIKSANGEVDFFNKDLARGGSGNFIFLNLTEAKKEELLRIDPGAELIESKRTARPGDNRLFPHDPKNYNGWTEDDYGPVWIPKAGVTVDLNMKNISMFKRVIDVYEHNDLEIKNNKIYINGTETNSYTFKQDYFWAMGDNRHNSEDSRAWGYVPQDHIVGKPLFIWFSTENGSISNGIRWNRLFKSADIF